MPKSELVQKTVFQDLRGANFSPDRVYRYGLWRKWTNNPQSTCLFIMLNPSTADDMYDDPTVSGCGKRSRMWGYDMMVVCNLFAYRATDPEKMKEASDPVGPDNDKYIRLWAEKADEIIAAWGNHGQFMDRDKEVLRLCSDMDIYRLSLTGTGHPSHPLYIPHSKEPALHRRANDEDPLNIIHYENEYIEGYSE